MSRTIYFVDSSVFTEFIKREPTKDELLFFHDLAVAYRRGYCYLCGNSDSLEYLCKQQPKIIGDIYAAALEHYSDSYSVMSLVQKIFVLTYQSKLELLPDVLRDAGKCYFIHIPTAIDENWRLYTECCLLTENLDDGDFYSFIAKYYCKERGIPQQRISFHRENGGGSTTFRVLEKCVSKEKMPTLCLADSDRKYGVTEKYPDLPEGDTLASIKKVSESWQKGDAPPHDLVGLDVHEAENLIPFQLLEELEQEQGFDMSKGVECICKLRGVKNGEPVLYYDFKKGFPYISKEGQKAYWREILFALGGDESCMPFASEEEYKKNSQEELFFPPLSNKIMRHVLNKFGMDEKENKLFSDPLIIDGYLKSHWEKIGLQMLTWGYVSEPLRA